MAKDAFSFDVVSEVDLQEVRNAFDQANREVATRFDFKNTGTSLSLDQDLLEVRSETDHRLKAAVEVLKEKLVRRDIPLKALQEGPIMPAAKGTVKQSLHINPCHQQGDQEPGPQGSDTDPEGSAAGVRKEEG